MDDENDDYYYGRRMARLESKKTSIFGFKDKVVKLKQDNSLDSVKKLGTEDELLILEENGIEELKLKMDEEIIEEIGEEIIEAEEKFVYNDQAKEEIEIPVVFDKKKENEKIKNEIYIPVPLWLKRTAQVIFGILILLSFAIFFSGILFIIAYFAEKIFKVQYVENLPNIMYLLLGFGNLFYGFAFSLKFSDIMNKIEISILEDKNENIF